MTISQAYADAVREGHVVDDPAQLQIVETLQSLQDQLHARRPLLSRLRALWPGKSDDIHIRGLYIWGGVGRGKTFLMDLFFASLNEQQKRRVHFHRMMSDVHSRLRSLDNVTDPLDSVAADVAGETRVLCFDEFFVTDIGDAMILGRFLNGLLGRGVTLVATSNVRPDELYQDGLQRERFLPAIELLEKHVQVIELGGDTDHRLRLMQKSGTYLSPAGEEARGVLLGLFDEIAGSDIEEQGALNILGREIETVRCAQNAAWFDFADICGGPRSQEDYIEIARWYPTVIVSDIPLLTGEDEDAARRFIALVDEFYDRRVKLAVSAAAAVDSIYQGSRLQFEFQRTQSRLIEMQSPAYLHKPHIA